MKKTRLERQAAGRKRIGRFAAAVAAALVSVAVASAGLAGCGPVAPESPSAPDFNLTVPWKAGESSKLDITKTDTSEVIATWDMEVRRDQDRKDWTLVTTTTLPGILDQTTIHADLETLVPVLVEYERTDEKGLVTMKGVYEAGKVSITANVYGQEQKPHELKLPPPPYFDNEQFIMVLRALPLANGWTGSLTDIVTKTAQKAMVYVKATGPVSVTVPAGTFDCWIVELVGHGQRAWVAKDQPHQLVQFENDQAKTRSVLREYTSGE